MSRAPKFSKLETVLRIRDSAGWIRSEWTIRHDAGQVDVATFWPNGERVEQQCAARLPLEFFCKTILDGDAERAAASSEARTDG